MTKYFLIMSNDLIQILEGFILFPFNKDSNSDLYFPLIISTVA